MIFWKLQSFYEELWMKGCHYRDRFKPVVCVDLNKGLAKVHYYNWISFADAMLQCYLFKVISQDMLLPTSFRAIHCDPITVTRNDSDGQQIVSIDWTDNHIMTNGLEIYGFGLTKARRRTQNSGPQTQEQKIQN